MPELAALLGSATERLRKAGCDTPRLDAEVLLAHALGCDRAALVLRAGEELACPAFETLVARRELREPVAYITGVREFRRISLCVDHRVLIPRPETELLVEAGLELPRGVSVLDVGTGSGPVALALKHERPDLDVAGVDVSADAVAVARCNAARLGLDVEFAVADLLSAVARPFDAVLANLPYVASGDSLAPEVSRYEPGLALFGGPDGLDVLRRLIASLGEVSFVALEVGVDQGARVARLLAREAGFAQIETRRDLAGIGRVVVGRR